MLEPERVDARNDRAWGRSPTEVQAWLRDPGHALGFDVHIAANDRNRPWLNVRWFRGERVAAAFEVEHSTSIYSGIVRLSDLALGMPHAPSNALFRVTPDGGQDEARAQA